MEPKTETIKFPSEVERTKTKTSSGEIRQTLRAKNEVIECNLGCEAGDIYLRKRHGISSKKGYATDLSIALILIFLGWWAVETKKVELLEAPSKQVIGPRFK